MFIEAVDDATGEPILGSIMPRLFTPPLVTGPPGPCGCGCALTPETSDGFEAVEFAERALMVPPDPWQRLLTIHALELLPDGRPRFRRVLVLVARQNGKTYLLSILTNYWMYLCGPMLILGSSTKTSMAVKAWKQAIAHAQAAPDLAREIPEGRGRGIKTGSGQEAWQITNGSRYEPVASNEDGGRGDPLDRVISDELRQHRDYSAYGASYHAMRARPYGQWWGISSMGDDRSIVLNDLRDQAITFIETGVGDERLGLFEWSAPTGADLLDPYAICQANPNAGRRFPISDILAEARGALGKGGEQLTDHKTEVMNIRVPILNAAIDAAAWALGAVPGSIKSLRGSLAAVADLSYDGRHATLVLAAPMPDGRIRLEEAGAWTSSAEDGPAVMQMERDLPGLLARIKPQAFARVPGPSDASSAALDENKKRKQWQPRGVKIEKITGAQVPGMCMAFAALVKGFGVVHSDQPLLNDHANGAEKLYQGDVWRFSRRGAGHCDGMYAAAGAVLLARTLPAPPSLARVTALRRTTN
jgi:hypothetical protein